MSDLMATVVISMATVIITLLVWKFGYSFGKADGLFYGKLMFDEQRRDYEKLIDEQRRGYEKFRDAVFSALEIKED